MDVGIILRLAYKHCRGQKSGQRVPSAGDFHESKPEQLHLPHATCKTQFEQVQQTSSPGVRAVEAMVEVPPRGGKNVEHGQMFWQALIEPLFWFDPGTSSVRDGK